jgi:hypothetical protein
MDWQFKIGIGVTLVFGFLQFAGVGRMPNWVIWPGISVGISFIILGILPSHQKIPIGLAILFIVCMAGMAVCFAWYSILKSTEKQISSKIIITAREVELIPTLNSKTTNKMPIATILSMINWDIIIKLSIYNDSPKECGVEGINMLIPDEDCLSLINNNDRLSNNYNNKKCNQLFIKSLSTKIVYPIIIAPNKLNPIEFKIPITYIKKEYLTENLLKHFRRFPIGIEVILLDYKGKSHYVSVYPFAEILFREDGRFGTESLPKSIDYLLK